MPTDVRLEVVALREALGALVALIGPLAGVRAHMDGQVVGPVEALAACVAQIRLGARVVTVEKRVNYYKT